MSLSTSNLSSAAAEPNPAGTAVVESALWRDYLELTKPRLNALVLVTTAVGFLLGDRHSGREAATSVVLGLHTMGGTALAAGGGAVLNQWMESELDGRMERTMHRPLPTGRVRRDSALKFGAALGVSGTVWLALAAGPMPALLAFATILVYALVYTPLKRVTSTCTLVGGIPGAIPPLIGFVAARSEVTAPGWSLFLILFVWQMPHFLAIAWMYRDDYARAGMPMLPVIDVTGRLTPLAIFSWSLIQLPVSLWPAQMGLVGPVYVISALGLGIVQLLLAANVMYRGTVSSARLLFFWTITYLPILLGMMVVDAVVLPGMSPGS